MFFYPLDFTFVCPTEITAFSDEFNKFSDLNTEVLGVSVDSKHCHLAWIQTPRNEGGIGDINYPLVSDLKREICQAYNVLNDDGEANPDEVCPANWTPGEKTMLEDPKGSKEYFSAL